MTTDKPMAKKVTFIDFEIIWHKLHGCISDDEQRLLDQWLEEDAAHRKFYEHVQRFYASGSAFKDKESIAKAWKKVLRAIEQPHLRRIRLFPYAAAVLLGALLTVGVYFLNLKHAEKQAQLTQTETFIEPGSAKARLILDNGESYQLSAETEAVFSETGAQIKNTDNRLEYIAENEVEPHTETLRYNTLEVPRGGEYQLVLSDGTKVWLNSETTLHYPVHFEKRERRVELNGEAYFEVAKNTDVPFFVTSGEQVVKVVGTSFNIASTPENAFILTTLVEGKVEVFLEQSPATKQLLLPNSQSRYNKAEKTLSQKRVDPYKYIAWKDGRFVFEDELLSDIMNTLSKWYNVEVVFTSDEARNLRFTGNLKRYDDFSTILRKIEKTNEIKFVITDHQVIVK